MSTPPSSNPTRASPAALASFRGLLMAGGVAGAIYWKVFESLSPTYLEASWLWFICGAWTLGPLVATFIKPWSTRSVIVGGILHPLVLALAGTWLGVRYGLSPLAVYGLSTLLVASGMAIALYSRTRRQLSLLLAAQVLAVAAVAVASESGGLSVEVGIFLLYLLILAPAMFLAGAARLLVTEQLRAGRDALDGQRVLLRTVIETIPDSIFVKDLESRVVLQNKGGGAGHSDLIGKTVFDLFPRAEAEKHDLTDQRVIRTGESTEEEYRYVTADGQEEIRLAIKVPLRDADGEISGIVAVSRDVTTQKRAEAEIRRAKELAENQQQMLQTVVDTIPETLFVINREGRFILRNATAVETHGGIGGMADEGPHDLFPPEVADALLAEDFELMETGQSLSEYEYEFTTPKGVARVGAATKIPLRSPTGEVIGLVGLIRDVTEEKEAAVALRDAKESAERQGRLLRTVVDAIPDMVFATDREGRCTLRNLADAQAIGCENPEETLGLTVFDTVEGARAQKLFDTDQAIMASGVPRLGAEDLVRIAGKERVYRTAKVPLRDDEGTVVGLVAIVRDVTAEKQVQEDLKAAKEAADEQRRMLRTIIDTIPDHVYVKDTEGRAILRNLASSLALGYNDTSEAIGYTDADTDSLHGADILEDDLRVVRDGVTVYNKEEQIARDEWLLTTKVPLRNEVGVVTGLVGISRDVTQRKVVETELIGARDAAEAATRAKSEFLANMSHEIRTPMNGVIGMTSLLLDTDLDREQRDFVETIRTSGDSLLTIINDILDFSKIEAGMLSLEVYPFDVRQCVEEALDLVAQTAAEKGVELAYFIEDGVPRAVRGDVTRVRQVLVNLLSNAVKFTAEGSVCVRVHAVPTDAEVGASTEIHFAVEDTGIGIPADKLALVFESFSQADASTTRQFGGTGLGLTICRRLVAMMGGQIGVESEIGIGSTFQFSVTAEVAPSERRVFLRREQPALEGRRVLVVDDNEVNREILTRLSKRWRMEETAVTCGPDALDAVDRATTDGRPFDLVLLDMQMPGMNGIEVARALRDRPGPTPVLVMLTSIHREGALRRDAEAAGVHSVLYKPTKPSQLYDVLIEAFEESAESAESPTAWIARRRTGVPEVASPPVRILLAEDNAVNQKVAVRLLGRLGYTADVAANGVEALAAVRRQPYDVVLMDVQMPEMDGLEATRCIRAEADLAQPTIIALTANAMQGDREACLEAGADDYLAKPVNLESMSVALEQAVQQRALARQQGDDHSQSAGDGARQLSGSTL